MYRDDAAGLRAEALGVVAALIRSAAGAASKHALREAYACLEEVGPPTSGPGAAADVGAHRRTSDFAKVHELLMQLSLCPGVDRHLVVRVMKLVTTAESHWVAAAAPRRGFAGRRRTDRQPPW